VLVHDDTPRVNWRLAVVEDTIVGEDSLVRAANIGTSTGKTNSPIVKLYPLEVTAEELSPNQEKSGEDETVQPEESDTPLEKRPVCKAAVRGRQLVKEWTDTLCGPLEDVKN